MQKIPTLNEMAIYVQEYLVEKYGLPVAIPTIKKHLKAAMKKGKTLNWTTEQVYGDVIRLCRSDFIA